MNKEIRYEELDCVSGGTVNEFKELLTVYLASTGKETSSKSEIPVSMRTTLPNSRTFSERSMN
jgi:hypothetical protein